MALNIVITVDNTDLERTLTSLERTISHEGITRYFATHMLPHLQQRAADRFRSEGDDASGEWEALHESTEYYRALGGFPPQHPINKRTGELENYITGGRGSYSAAGDVTTMEYPGGTLGGELRSKVETAQKGNPDQFNEAVPARPVLAVSMVDMTFFRTSLAEYIQRGVG